MSGYIRSTADEWQDEHYERTAWFGRRKSAPSWWINLDIAWSADRRKLPSAREAGEHWGVDKNKAARLIRESVKQQAAWEARADRRAAILRMLEEWAKKEPKQATAATKGQKRDRGGTQHEDGNGTGDHGSTPETGDESGQNRDAIGTGKGQGRDTSRVRLSVQPPAVQPPEKDSAPPAPPTAPAAGPVCDQSTPTEEPDHGADRDDPRPDDAPATECDPGDGRGPDAPAVDGAGAAVRAADAVSGGVEGGDAGDRGSGAAGVTPCAHATLDDDTGACAACGASMDDVRLDADQDRALAEHFKGGALFAPSVSPTPATEALPKWVPAASGCGKHPRLAVLAMVVRACEAMVGQPRNPEACGTNSRPVLSLWSTLGKPDPAAFAEDLALVIRWAQLSPDPLAQNDIRGVRADGTHWKGDHSRTMATLCVQERWDARLEAARAWEEAGEPGATHAPPARRGGRPDAAAAWSTLETLGARVHRGDPIPEGQTDHEREVLDVFRRSVGWRRWHERSSFTRGAIQRDFAAAWSSAHAPPPHHDRRSMEQV